MKAICWVFIYGIFVTAATNITIPELENSPNVADLTLETVLGFNSTENADNINFLDKVQKVIGNIKSVFERKSSKRRAFNSEKVEKFTDFIQNLIKKLIKYDDAGLKYFITVFNDEVRKYHYRGCKFHELIQNHSLRRYLSSTLNDIQVQPAEVIRDQLKVFANKLEEEKYNKYEENLVEIINSVYRKDSVKNFKYFLIDVDSNRLKAGKMNSDLVETIRDGLRLIIFDHYSQLNLNARMELKFKVNEFWKYLSQNELIVPANSVKSFRALNFDTDTKSNNISMNTNMNTDPKQSLQTSNKSTTLKQDENKFIKPKNESTTEDPMVTSKSKIKHIKKSKHNYRKRAQTMTTKKLITKTKKLTFKTLYPKLMPEWTRDHLLVGEVQFSRRSHERQQKVKDAIYKKDVEEDKSFDDELATAIKDSDRSSHVPRKFKKSDKLKKEVPIKRRDHNERKANRRVLYHKASRQKHPKKFNRRNIFYKHMIDLSSESGDTTDSIVTDEGLSIEGFKELKANISKRRSDTALNITTKTTVASKSTVTELNSYLETEVTVVLPKAIEELTAFGTIDMETKNETSDKDKIRGDNKYQKNSKVDSIYEVEKIYEITSKEENKELDNSKASSSTSEVSKATTYISPVDQLLNVTERSHVNQNKESHTDSKNNKELPNVFPQTTRDDIDDRTLLNFRAMAASNETETVIESAKNKENIVKNDVILRNNSNKINFKKDLDETQAEQNKFITEQDENQPEKSKDQQNLKTDNDFKSFISDYENGLNEFKKSKVTEKTSEASSLVTERNTNTETTTLTTPILRKTTATQVTENPRLSTFAYIVPDNAINNRASFKNINKNRYLQSTTDIPNTFDAKFIKELMKTTKKPTTTRISTIMGRKINEEGVIFDSLEQVKLELYDTAQNLMNYDYEQGKGSEPEDY